MKVYIIFTWLIVVISSINISLIGAKVDDIHSRIMQTGNLLLIQEKDAEFLTIQAEEGKDAGTNKGN